MNKKFKKMAPLFLLLGTFGLNSGLNFNINDDAALGRVVRESHQAFEALKDVSPKGSASFRVAENGQALTESQVAASGRLYKRLKNEVQPGLLELLKSSKYVNETVLLQRAKEASLKLENFVKFLEGVQGSPKSVTLPKPAPLEASKPPVPPKKNQNLPRPPRPMQTSSASRAPLSNRPLVPVAVAPSFPTMPKKSPETPKPSDAKSKVPSLPPLPGSANVSAQKPKTPKLPSLPSAPMNSVPLKSVPKPPESVKPPAAAPTNFPAPPGMPPKRGGPPF